MNDKDQILLEKAYDLVYNKANPLLLEKYIEYSVPNDTGRKIYDFYVLNYLDFSVKQMPVKNYRDEDEEIKNSVADAFKKNSSNLRAELLNDVAASINSEIVGEMGEFGSLSEIDKNKLKTLLTEDELKYFISIQKIFNKSGEDSTEKQWQKMSLFLDQNNIPTARYIRFCHKLFGKDFEWNTYYGQGPWQIICEGWLRLAESTKSSAEEVVAIDHIFDLQHNNGSVFDKLAKYTKDGSVDWLEDILDHKATVTNIYQLLNDCSGSVRSLAVRVLKERYGKTKEVEGKKAAEPVVVKKRGGVEVKVNGKLQSIDGQPARTESNQKDKTWLKEWYNKGVLHREDGPASIRVENDNGKLLTRTRYYINGQLHRQGGPAEVWTDRKGKTFKEIYSKNGKQIKEMTAKEFTEPRYYNESGTKITKEEYDAIQA